MTAFQRRITLAVCLIVGMSLLMSAGLTFLVAPMAQSLGLADNVVEDVLAMPSVAALIMVFSAGQLGDRLGSRRTLMIASVAFAIGSVCVLVAFDEYLVEAGLAVCAAAAVTMQIVGVSLLQRTAGEGPAHVSAFTSYGVVFPLAFLIYPLATARVLLVADWRIIPTIWAAAGLVMLVLTAVLLDKGERTRSTGEWLTPLLAGIALASGTRAISEIDDVRLDPPVLAVSLIVFATAALTLLLVRRRLHPAGISIDPVRRRQLPLLMAAVALVSLAGILTYVSIAVEYLYDLTPYQAALAVTPAQIGAILGAKLLAKRLITRWGGLAAGRGLMIALAVSMLPMLALTVGSPLWFITIVATVFSFVWMALLTTLNSEVMLRAPREQTGAVSSFRTAASSIGGAIGVGILGAIVISSVPVEAGAAAASLDELTRLANSLRLDAVLASVIAVAGWLVLTIAARRERRD